MPYEGVEESDVHYETLMHTRLYIYIYIYIYTIVNQHFLFFLYNVIENRLDNV